MGKGMGEANNVLEENKQMLLNLNQPFFKSDADRLSVRAPHHMAY